MPGHRRPASMLAPDTFRFLNATAVVSGAADWNDERRARLWQYNLHYFDDLNAVEAWQRAEWHRTLIHRWVHENPPAGGTGWEPYPTSLRVVNWIKWRLQGNPLEPEAVASLAVQTRWLRKRLETHLLGNHLWSNAKALAFSGAFFSGSEADRWLRKGLGLIGAQLREQVLSDGGHFERSPMYHALFLEDVLDVINLAAVYPTCVPQSLSADLREVAGRMLRWLRVMTHPDGQIALFNDAAFNIAPEYAATQAYARRLGIEIPGENLGRIEVLHASGYARLENERAVVICDAGPIGPDFLPAHAHADTLSFELSVDGQRVIVNGGTSTYEESADRERQRGTAAHSTVVVDNQNSSEVWSAFRVAHRARPVSISWGITQGGAWLEGSHDGYARDRRGVIHRRRWLLGTDELSVTDELHGQHTTAHALFHLHPAVQAEAAADGQRFDLRVDNRLTLTVAVSPGCIRPAPSTWHPEFGLSVEASTLMVTVNGGFNVAQIRW